MKQKLIFSLLICLTSKMNVFCQMDKSEIRFDKSILTITKVGSSKYMDYYKSSIKTTNKENPNSPIFALTIYYPSSLASAKNYLNFQKNSTEKKGTVFTKQTTVDTVINGLTYFLITATSISTKTHAPENFLYGCVLKDKNAIMFLGSDLGQVVYIEKLKKTFYTIN